MLSREREQRCFVRVDLPRFIQNAAEAGITLSTSDAASFLAEWGFIHCHADLWHCNAPALASLKASEILEVLSGPPPVA